LAGASVFRTPVWVPSKPGGLKRIVHLMSFAVSSAPAIVAQYFWRPDVVFVTEPPLFCAPFAVFFSRVVGAKAWLHVHDYEVDAAFDLGLLKGKFIRKVIHSAERFLMRSFDRVSTISGRMIDKAASKGVSSNQLLFFPNWVDISSIFPFVGRSAYRKDLGIADDAVVALYSGNMGGKQGLEILADAARYLANSPEIQFIFCGNGAGKTELQERCDGLSNVHFLDLQPLDRLNELLGSADIHLLPQRADAADLVMPSKLTGMLASGRPVVATALPATELGRVVSAHCGLIAPPEDVVAFAQAIKALAISKSTRESLGASARLYAEENLDRVAVIRKFEIALLDCVNA
jgi:colanic acid biosynthesis glycosyl transferase WcaI